MIKSRNLVGQKFGKGTVITEVAKPSHLKRVGRYWSVLCECGQTRVIDTTTLKTKWTNCGCNNEEDLTEIRFHHGIVDGLFGKDDKGHRVWKVKCDCGNNYKAFTESLKSGNTKSCGCLNRRIGKEHPHYKGCGDLSGDYWSKLKRGARTRNLSFRLSIKTTWDLFLKQNKKCALTGWDITLSSSMRYASQTASLDRINSKKHYMKSNVQWVHKDINKIKQDYSQEYFLSMCEAVTLQGGNN
jgi:hypothetical protein